MQNLIWFKVLKVYSTTFKYSRKYIEGICKVLNLVETGDKSKLVEIFHVHIIEGRVVTFFRLEYWLTDGYWKLFWNCNDVGMMTVSGFY